MRVAVIYRLFLCFFWVNNVTSGALAIGEPIGEPPSEPRTTPDLPPELCVKTEQENPAMISLRPLANQYSLTTRENPAILFYIPYATEAGEFIVYQGNTPDEFYRSSFTLPNASGIVSVPINRNLLSEQYYRWYFRVNCNLADGTAHETISGWIHRQVASANITSYYDELAEVALSQSEEKSSKWFDLLVEIDELDSTHPDGDIDSVDLVDYSQEPIWGPVNIISESANTQ